MDMQVKEIAQLAREGRFQVIEGPNGDKHAIVPSEYLVARIENAERKLFRISQTVSMESEKSFCAYVNRFKSTDTRLFATAEPKACITAIIDYHKPPTDETTPGHPDYGVHVVNYAPKYAEEWERWTKAEPMGQREFAEFIEENRRDIVKPDAAVLLDIVTKFRASRRQEFNSLTYQPNGDILVHYSEQTENAGQPGVPVPTDLELGIPVFFKGDTFKVPVFMRYRIDAGHLVFGIKVDRADYIVQAAFDDVIMRVEASTGIEAYLGTIS